MGKVKVSKEVAEAIEFVRNELRWRDDLVIRRILSSSWERPETEILNAEGDYELSMKIINALINGYEIELTPEEKVAEYFSSIKVHYEKYRFDRDSAKLTAVKDILAILGIKIEGINA